MSDRVTTNSVITTWLWNEGKNTVEWEGGQADVHSFIEGDQRADEATHARLIAAAPDLYEALDRLLKFSVELCEDIGIGINADAQRQARGALKRAVQDVC
jgi:hypothetical protein